MRAPTNGLAAASQAVLSTDWHMRPNRGGGLVYRFTTDDSKLLGLHAEEALIVALCDGRRPLAEAARLMAQMLETTPEQGNRFLDQLLRKNREDGPFLIPVEEAGGGFTKVNTVRLMHELAAYRPRESAARRLEVPLSLLLLPTYHCYADCIYCYSERPALPAAHYLRPERWVEVLEEAGRMGVDLLTFSGGDPLGFKGLEKLMAVAARYRMCFLVPTKTPVSARRAKSLAAVLGEYGQIQVSVDSFDPEVAAALSRVDGFAGQARSSIRYLNAAGVAVRTNTVVTPLNLDGIADFIRELRELGVHRAHLTNYYRTHYRHDDGLFLTARQIERLNSIVRELRTELAWPELKCNAGSRDFTTAGARSPEEWKARSSCSGGFSNCVILPNGDVILCEQSPHTAEFVVGNLKKQSLLDVWNSQALMDFIVPDRRRFAGTACFDCDEFDSCHRLYGRCFRDAYFTYGGIYTPSPNCPRAPAGIRMA